MEAVTRNLWQRLQDSLVFPVLMKEMRSRMRGIRAPLLLFIGTGLAILVGLLILVTSWGHLDSTEPRYLAREIVDSGRALFVGLMVLEGILCAIIAPAVTAGAISVEREQQTLEFLLLTRLSGANIALGKLTSALGLIVLLMVCTLPVGAISFLLGGVAPDQLIWSSVLLFTIMLLFGSTGLYCSARFRKTTTAVVVTYIICVAWVGLLPLTAWFVDAFGSSFVGEHDVLFFFIFIAFALLIAMALGAALTALLSVLVSAIIRRPLPRVANLGIWGACTAALCLLLSLPGVMDNIEPMVLLYGNPIVAFVLVLSPGLDTPFPSLWTGAPWLFTFLIQQWLLVTVIVHILFSVMMMSLAVSELRRLRD